jgi:hypothetical protein
MSIYRSIAARPTTVMIPAALLPIRIAPLVVEVLDAEAPEAAPDAVFEPAEPVAAEPPEVLLTVAAEPDADAPAAPEALAEDPEALAEPLALAFAAAWKASNVLAAVGFTANTIPAAQWTAGVVWAQKNHRGAVALSTVKLHEGNDVALAATNWKPESIPTVGVSISWHGLANVDWVTEWFFAWNSKTKVSPTFAVTLVGLNVRVPFPPTAMLMLAARTARTDEAAATAREKRIMESVGRRDRRMVFRVVEVLE